MLGFLLQHDSPASHFNRFRWPIHRPVPQVGYSGINVTGGGGPMEPNIMNPKKYMDLILCTQKNTRLEIIRIMLLDPVGTLA